MPLGRVRRLIMGEPPRTELHAVLNTFMRHSSPANGKKLIETLEAAVAELPPEQPPQQQARMLERT